MGNDRSQLPPVQVHHPADGDVQVEKSADQQDRESAWKAIEAFADQGKGKAADLPMLIKRAAWNDGVIPKLPAIAKRVSGDVILDCARIADMGAVAAINLAYTAKSAPTKDALHRYLQELPTRDAAGLEQDPALITKLRTTFKEPFGALFPQLARSLFAIQSSPRLLEWYVATTDKTIAGMALADLGTDTLALTLDTVPGGWDWLDAFRLAASDRYGYNILGMRDATKDATAKTKLEGLATKFVEDMDARAAAVPDAQVAMADQLTKKDDDALLDAAARTQGSMKGGAQTVDKRLAGAPVDTVLEYCVVTNQDIERGIELIDHAKGARVEHLRELMRTKEAVDVAKALASDATRKIVRKHFGRDASLRGLFANGKWEEIHEVVVKDKALRQWVYEDKHPETLLWLAAGSGPGSAEGTQLVKREKTNNWVKKLSPGADEASLRRFVLNSADRTATAHVKEQLLHDPPEASVDPADNDVVTPDRTIYGDRAKRQFEVTALGRDPQAEIERLADLDERERAEVLKDATYMKYLLDDLSKSTLLRAMFLLRPTLMKLLTLPFPADRAYPELLSYMTTRPAVEGHVAAKSADSIKAARRLIGGDNSPFEVFPALRDERILAKVLPDNDALFEWIMEETEPSYAMSMLARDGVRQIAANMMGERQTLTDNMPEYKHMLSEGKTGYKIIHERLDKQAKEDSDEYLAGDSFVDNDADARAKALKGAAKKHLWDGIDKLFENNGDKQSYLTLVRRAPADQQVALLDGSHEDSVRHLRHATAMKPQQIFFQLTADQLFSLKSAAEWLFLWEDPTILLAMMQNQKKAVRVFAKHVDADPQYLSSFGFPRGGALMPHERLVIDDVAKQVTTVGALKELFTVRFDVTAENWDLAETRRLWQVVARLPPAQFNQNAVAKVVEKDIGPLGQWADPDIEMDDTSSRYDSPDNAYDANQKMTLDEVKQLYGMSEQDVMIAADPDSGWLIEDQGKYTVKSIEIAQFDSTVLHEIGHSIDTMLGDRTDLVFGIGGWKEYGIGQFEQWASDMNGFDGLDTAQKPQVVEAWKQALHSGTPVKRLVDDTHPAIKGNTATPLVDAAQRESLFRYTEFDKVVYGDRVCITNGQRLFSMPKLTYLSAPSEYGLSAPPEFFAECYVEYYRAYDGTPSTETKKGGKLPSWIKEWFRYNVDAIRLNPNRVRPKP